MTVADYATERAYTAMIAALYHAGHLLTVEEAIWTGLITPAEFAACIAYYAREGA